MWLAAVNKPHQEFASVGSAAVVRIGPDSGFLLGCPVFAGMQFEPYLGHGPGVWGP